MVNGNEGERKTKATTGRRRRKSPPKVPQKVNGPDESDAAGRHFPIVGIGSSAGGLEALKKIFSATPPDSGMAFVLIQHLDPTHESLMVELLARHTTMKVVQISNGMPVAPNRIHIIPPNTSLTIKDGILLLSKPIARRGLRLPVDTFLEALAVDQQENAIGIILSGTGSDGTLGIKEIKVHGGLAVAQDPETAQYDGMPKSAIMTGLVDYILPVEQIPSALIGYLKHSIAIGRGGDPLLIGAEERLKKIFMLLHVRTGHDFRCYKRNTLIRRLQRRMTINHLREIQDYLAYIETHPEEIEALDKDLLISVTHFFREPEVWEYVNSTVVTKLIDRCGENQPARVWVPGCATGEEAYTLAILLLEEADRRKRECQIQIYATDIDREALDVARRGVYPENIAEQVSAERLNRYFTRRDSGSYQVAKRLREMVVVAPQNLISDPPFSRLDMISCRNVLIYIQLELQKKIISMFHFALRNGGYLLLGNAESIGQMTGLFDTMSKKWRVYQQKGSVRRMPVDLPLGLDTGRAAGQAMYKLVATPAVRFADIAKTQLINRFTPPSVLVNDNYETLFVSGSTKDFLSIPEGLHTDNVLEMAEPVLRPKLRTALHKAGMENREFVMGGIRLTQAETARTVRLTVSPVAEGGNEKGLFLVSFEYEPKIDTAYPDQLDEISEESVIRRLEDELRQSREELQSTIEQMETSNEELKASNEEVMSMNEELQSTNEELETSREELQSLNEELSTLNSQLQDKVQDLEVTTDDLNNLLTSTNIATIFLSADFKIKRFTPAATELLRMIPSDIGRPLEDISRKFSDEKLFEDARRVLDTLVPEAAEVLSDDDKWYTRRIQPYRTQDNRIEGLVVTFSDVTELKRAQQRIERYAAIVKSSHDAILSKTLDGIITSWNKSAESLYGFTEEEMIGKSITCLVPVTKHKEIKDILGKLAQGKAVDVLETERIRKDGTHMWTSLSASPVRDAQGKIIGASTIIRDISAKKRQEEEISLLNLTLKQRVAELQTVFETAPIGIVVANDSTCCNMTLNSAGALLLGLEPGQPFQYDESQPGPLPFKAFRSGRELKPAEWPMQRAAQEKLDIRGEVVEHVFADGSTRLISVNASSLLNENGHVRGAVATLTDVTEQKRFEEKIQNLNENLNWQNEELEASNRELEFFVYSVSHDLRAPLRSIAGFSQILQKEGQDQLDDKGRDYLNRIYGGVVKMSQIIEALLHLSRISKQEMARVTVDLSAITASITAELGNAEPKRNVQVDIQEGLSSYADKQLIRIAMTNLLNNAWKFTSKTESARIEFGATAEDGKVIYYVKDNGAGFDDQHAGKMFWPFHRMHSDLEFEGTGIGLAIVERIIRRHGGRIWADSVKGQGATVSFTLG